MRGIVVSKPTVVESVDLPEPSYNEFEALVEISSWSLCSGTDTHIIDGSFPGVRYPCVLGHETLGRVLTCGTRVTSFKPGDLVLRPVAVRPGEQLGEYVSFFGGFAELGVVADAEAIRAATPRGQIPPLPPFAAAQQVVPADFPASAAGVFITFKEALSSLYDLGAEPGHSLLVLGSGPVGLNFIAAAKRLGAYPVLATGRRDEPLQRALAYGADAVIDVTREDITARVRDLTDGRGADYAIEAIGSWEAFQGAIPAMARNGRLGIYGVATSAAPAIDWSRRPSGLTVRFVQPAEELVHRQALDWLRLGIIDLEPQVSNVFTMDAFGEGLAILRGKTATKVVYTR